MASAAAQIAIENQFNTNFSGCPVSYQNVPYTPEPGTTYCEFEVLNSVSHRAEIGSSTPLHRNYGLINVNFFLPLGSGTNAGRVLADTAAAIFRDQSFSGITCRSPLVKNIGEVEGWYVINMNCFFYHDEIYP